MAHTKRRPPLPRFRSEAEEARFWDTHDSIGYLGAFKPVKVTFTRPKPKVLVSLRIAKSEVEALRHLAARKGLGYASLMRLWLTERLLEELHAHKH